MIKNKKCRGTGKAKNWGCGKMVPANTRHYGLCLECKKKWIFSTPEGQAFLEKITLRSKRNVEKEIKQEQRKKKEETKRKIATINEVRKKLQVKVNALVRLIDNGNPCIASGNLREGMMDAGHYISVGANLTISLNLHNIHVQHRESNSYRGGDTIRYREGIVKVYGKDYLNFMEGLQSCKKRLDKEELYSAILKANEAIRELKSRNLYLLTPKERITLRNRLNAYLDLYPDEYATYQ